MQRDNSGRFLPGESTNPGGRPSGVKELRALARQWTKEALDVLVKHLRDADPRVDSRAGCPRLGPKMQMLDRVPLRIGSG